MSRQQRFDVVQSTNDVVRGWLGDGIPEVCLAVADEQTAGRGRSGRAWVAPRGAALLLSLGFRPTWLPPERTWRIPATVSLAMADAAEEVAGLPDGTVRLKWPNDLVVESSGEWPAGPSPSPSEGPASPSPSEGPASPSPSESPAPSVGTAVLKLAGVLGESDGLGGPDPRLAVGIGVNAEWRYEDFPSELAAGMTSLHEASRGRPIDLAMLLDGFLGRLVRRALRAGRSDLADWNARQVTTGRAVEVQWPDGDTEHLRALGVDASSGGLVVVDRAGGELTVVIGEIRHVRLSAATGASV